MNNSVTLHAIAEFIVKNKQKVIAFLKSKGVNISPSVSEKDLSAQLYMFGFQSHENAAAIENLINGGKSNATGLLGDIIGIFTGGNSQSTQDQANAAMINTLTTKVSTDNTIIIVLAIVVVAVLGYLIYSKLSKK